LFFYSKQFLKSSLLWNVTQSRLAYGYLRFRTRTAPILRFKHPRDNAGHRRVYEYIGDSGWFPEKVREIGRFLEP